MEMLSPQEKSATELSHAEREGILWDAARRYMRGEITAQELSEIEDRYSQSIRRSIIHTPEVVSYAENQEKKSA